ncbi:MAG: NifB/NifX family molybdenum-iron cluster-binding protein [Leptolinea sp.]
MKIAIVSDDHQTISAHFGRALFYEIFTIEAGKVTNREAVTRSFPQVVTIGIAPEPDGEHHHHHDHNAMIIPIADCQALITRGMGTGAHVSLQENDIQPVITDITDIQAALDAYLAGTLIDHPEKLH